MGYSTYADFSTKTIPLGNCGISGEITFHWHWWNINHTRLVTNKAKLYFRGMSGTSGSGNTFLLPPGPFHTTWFTHLVCDWWNQPTIFWGSTMNGTSHPTFYTRVEFWGPLYSLWWSRDLVEINCGKKDNLWKSGGKVVETGGIIFPQPQRSSEN